MTQDDITRMMTIIKAEIPNLIRDYRVAEANPMSQDVPPAPRRVNGAVVRGPRNGPSKRAEGKRTRLGVSIDSVLVDLFEQERDAKGFTSSKLAQHILWNRYEKPKLSFESLQDFIDRQGESL